MTLRHAKRPCDNCPWRKDAEPGEFQVERYRNLARSAYDLSNVLFACHKTPEGKEAVCTGFLLRGAQHNLAVRFALMRGEIDPETISCDAELYGDYRAMAEANGVDPEDPILRPCRGVDS
jgi:hypothetical protein